MTKPKDEKVNASEPKETPKPIRPPRKTEQSLRVNFTNQELLEIGKKLAEAANELAAAEGEKKSITSQLKAKCDGIASRIEQHSGELTSGYTYRKIPCETRFDCPDKGQKTTVRLDTNETISVEAMTLAEMQAELPLASAPGVKSEPDTVRRSTAGDGTVLTEEDGDGFIDDKNNP